MMGHMHLFFKNWHLWLSALLGNVQSQADLDKMVNLQRPSLQLWPIKKPMESRNFVFNGPVMSAIIIQEWLQMQSN